MVPTKSKSMLAKAADINNMTMFKMFSSHHICILQICFNIDKPNERHLPVVTNSVVLLNRPRFHLLWTCGCSLLLSCSGWEPNLRNPYDRVALLLSNTLQFGIYYGMFGTEFYCASISKLLVNEQRK